MINVESGNDVILRSRYYDPTLGRFLQADSQIMPAHTNGLNRYMYVNGQPTRGVDPSGHRISTSLAWGIIWAVSEPQLGLSTQQAFAIGYGYGSQRRHDRRRTLSNPGTALSRATFMHDPYKAHGMLNSTKAAILGYLRTGTMEGAIDGYLYGNALDQNKERRLRQGAFGSHQMTLNLAKGSK